MRTGQTARPAPSIGRPRRNRGLTGRAWPWDGHERLRAAARSAVLCGIAAVTAAGSVTGCASPAVRPSGPAVVAAAQQRSVPVAFNCNSARVRPSEFVLTCADVGDFLDRLR